ncbi:ATP-binding protein [Verminephrobacter eiseniae]|nr:ATP-binding protein [Verminephrobacter eiseniae]MCW5283320.1 ATP-binding protein [Verminephrobacter eiseniae]MCW5303637.1 ATP-binding protein [Verminephrobacter eiseniae]MCW8178202.1 ATP-binding protein [Verminephrobacter eiseniae]MCW8188431.1 ATP-binding protein [Verminephrobacter eiseniae]
MNNVQNAQTSIKAIFDDTMTSNISLKHSAIPLSGYLYQNLVGIKLLCDWLDDPNLYDWVKFEADDDESPKGLDDIVAHRTDGLLDLYQVKFTVDPSTPKNFLSWEWLLEHRPKGKSLIQKWYAAWESASGSPVHLAALVTNRRPDREFQGCMNAAALLVEFDKIPADARATLLEQLPSADRAESFFRTFNFQHSYQGFLSLRGTLSDRLVGRHTTYHGWHTLLNATVDWAIRKNFPPPHGQITLDIIRGEIDSHRPAPLNQSFQVPAGYEPPSIPFHQKFSAQILSTSSRIFVLWGSPGQGKSTYLSFLCKEFEQREIPYIRQHYFLDLSDPSERFSLVSVANSMMAQMENYHGQFVDQLSNKPESLRQWIEACALGYQKSGKQFVIVVDGLDHIWRENDRDIAPLDSLFQHLLPLPQNAVLVIGTQRVSVEQLPSRLNNQSEPEDWYELPLMSQASTRCWLEERHRSGQFELHEQNGKQSEIEKADLIAQFTEAFQTLSQGHPLHLTYSFEAMKLQHRILRPEEVAQLAACPDGDIRGYYKSLWQRLSYDAKDALHLVADSGFPWPVFSLEDTLGIRPGILQTEIRHLLYDSEAGLIPFHGSLPAFIRELEEHDVRTEHLAPKVVKWLNERAPAYHRWGWLWLYQARCGSTDNLVFQPGRDWIIKSMSKAYPKKQLIKILTSAETAAFSQKNFARAVRLRWLKIRLQNGTTFQIDNPTRIDECALSLTDDDYPLKNLSTAFRTANIADLLLLGRQYLRARRIEEAIECRKAIGIRLADTIRSGTANARSHESDVKALLELCAATSTFESTVLKDCFRRRAYGPSRFRFFIGELAKLRDIDKLLRWLPIPLPYGMRSDLELEIVRVAGINRISLHEYPEFGQLRKHPISECWARLYAPSKARPIPFSLDASVYNKDAWYDVSSGSLECFLHGLFFYIVAKTLEVKGANLTINPPTTQKRKWLNEVLTEITRCAALAGKMLVRHERPKFDFLFAALSSLPETKDYDTHADHQSLKRALLAISKDLFLISGALEAPRLISGTEWTRAKQARHFWFHGWLEDCLRTGVVLIESDIVRRELADRMATIKREISQIDERANSYLALCELACKTDSLEAIGKSLLHSSLACVMGYGCRKDPTIHHVLDAIQAVAQADANFAKSMLIKICPVVANISVITDGSETRHALATMAVMFAKYMPETYADMYDHLLKSGEWYLSECALSAVVPTIVGSAIGRNVIGPTMWDAESVGKLRALASAGSVYANEIIEINSKFLGLASLELGDEEKNGTSFSLDDGHGIDISVFGPHQYEALIDALHQKSQYIAEERMVREWFAYWRGKGKGAELLRNLRKYLTEENVPTGISSIFDSMFEISLRLDGTVKAYRWLVAAQIHRKGWDEFYYREEEALNRFKVFASHYAARWEDFIFDTTTPKTGLDAEPLAIPHSRLVHFLHAVGQISDAIKITKEMVNATVEEVSDIPLPIPLWFKGN